MSILLRQLAPMLRPKGKESFLCSLPADARVLDVGCGNNSPVRAKACAPDIHYTGLDIGDYNQVTGSISSADEYLIALPEDFAAAIERLEGCFDAVVSSHNLEHCNEPDRVLRAICGALRSGGRLYLTFPSEASTKLPNRPRNTLNFHDDPTHTRPPKLTDVLAQLQAGGLTVDRLTERHRPLLPLLAGLLLEPVSILTRRAMPFGTTWALYGFETVIWARR